MSEASIETTVLGAESGTAARLGARLPVVEDDRGAASRGTRPAVGPSELAHRDLRSDEFWRVIPAYRDLDAATFLDYRFQNKNAVTRLDKLRATVQGLASEGFYADLAAGLGQAPMSVRVSPYVIALIDWSNPVDDPLRRQFLPIASGLLPDHPWLTLDSLHEKADAPVEGLTHRYPDKALFLTLDTCPVYCRFCTRSYAVGLDTPEVEKVQLKATMDRWDQAFAYVRSRPELEDIVVSGGDAYNLRPDQIELIGRTLLEVPHLRRMRFATKGVAVLPQKLLTDEAWTGALFDVAKKARAAGKEVVVHTHFNHPNEVTEISRQAVGRLFAEGITVRNQSVLLRGVNDDADTMRLLVRRMGYINVHGYYVYQHDLVKGVEDLRTTVAAACELEKEVRGATAGFNTPTFVVDAPGGGGKRQVHSYEFYDEDTGISVYRSPNVRRDAYYLYFDPIDRLSPAGRARWDDAAEHPKMVEEALAEARARHTARATRLRP